MKENVKNKFVPFMLGVLQIFIGVTAIMGGFGLVSDPTGAKMNVPLGLLKNSPFTSYLIPGLILLIFNGFGNVLAGIATFVRNRHAGNLAIFLGVFLILYISIEVWIIGLQNLSQPLYFFLGLVELTLGIKLSKSIKKSPQILIKSTEAKMLT